MMAPAKQPTIGFPPIVARDNGFTLIEVLVALALLGLVFAVIFGSLRITSRASIANEIRAARAEQLVTSHRLLRRFLERAYPLSWKDGNKLRFAFKGGAKSLSFTTLLPAYPSVAGPYVVKLYSNKTKNGEALWLNLKPYRREPDQGVEPKTIEDIVLIPAPINVGFSYYGAPNDETDPRWVSDWDADERMPSLVRLSVRGSDAEAGAWPDLVIPIGIDMDVGCLFELENNPAICRLDEAEAAALRKPGPEDGNATKDDAQAGAKEGGTDAKQPIQ